MEMFESPSTSHVGRQRVRRATAASVVLHACVAGVLLAALRPVAGPHGVPKRDHRMPAFLVARIPRLAPAKELVVARVQSAKAEPLVEPQREDVDVSGRREPETPNVAATPSAIPARPSVPPEPPRDMFSSRASPPPQKQGDHGALPMASDFGNATAIPLRSQDGSGTDRGAENFGAARARVSGGLPPAVTFVEASIFGLRQSSSSGGLSVPVDSDDESVRLTNDPRPHFTADALARRIQGDVLLKVIFRAIGIVDVVGVVLGLGHGLDEAAIEAAHAIQFRPARHARKAVDVEAIIRVLFRISEG